MEYRKREPYDCAKYHRYERTEWNTDENRRKTADRKGSIIGKIDEKSC